MMRLALVVVAFALSTLPALAQDKSSGCGPGWWVTKNYSFSATTTRGTFNSTVTPFAMTTGTSGCQKHTIVWNERRGFEFMLANYDAIAVDVARGEGEYLSTFGRSLGCDEHALGAFGQALRGHYREVFQHPNAEAAFESVRTVIRHDSRLIGCLVAG